MDEVKTRALIYSRFSPRPNADLSTSIDKQIEVCTAYCNAKGYTIDGLYEDRAASGDNADRPGLWLAIGALKRGDVLVVRWRSRLARSVYLDEVIVRSVTNAGATIEAAEGELNGDNPQDQMARQILSVFREYERKIIAARTKCALLRYQNQDHRVVTHRDRLPYGWQVDPANDMKMIKHDGEQETIAIVLQMRECGLCYRQMLRQLEDMGIQSRVKKPLSLGTVRNILSAPSR